MYVGYHKFQWSKQDKTKDLHIISVFRTTVLRYLSKDTAFLWPTGRKTEQNWRASVLMPEST